MNKLILFITISLGFAVLLAQPSQAQGILKKIKQKTEDKVVNGLFGDDDKSSSSNDNPNAGSSKSSNSISNSKGGGLNSESPNVIENIGNAEQAFDKKDYSDARYAVRQAILGIEMEIGQRILDDLPKEIAGLEVVGDEDNITSSGIGFVGMVISRVYRSNDKELRITIGNDAAMLSAANAYLASGAYATSSSEQDYKALKFQEERGVISWDENSGYSLSVPFGQSSVFVAEGVNFQNEDEFMSASNEISLSNIKNQLGEK